MRKVSGAPFFVVVSVCFRGSESQTEKRLNLFFCFGFSFFSSRKIETEEETLLDRSDELGITTF